MKFRQERGAFQDSLTTLCEMEPTREAVAKLASEKLGLPIMAEDIDCRPYELDSRFPEWKEMHLIVLSNGRGIFGYCDQDINAVSKQKASKAPSQSQNVERVEIDRKIDKRA